MTESTRSFSARRMLAGLQSAALACCWIALALACHVCEAQQAQPALGLPKTEQAYKQARALTLAGDAKLRFDADVTLSDQEQAFNEKLVKLRTEMVDGYKKEQRFPPSQQFYAVKEEIRSTPLYQILRQMPKGGVLHIHTSSTAPVDWVVSEGILEPHCYVCWPADAGGNVKGQLGFFDPTGKLPAYQVPPGYQLVKDVLSQDPDFPQKLKSLLTINATDAGLTSLSIWEKFNGAFQRIGGFVKYQPLHQKYYKAAFLSLVEDNVPYVEMRTGMSGLYDLTGKQWDTAARADLLWQIREEIRQTHPEFDLKLIYSGWRGGSEAQVLAEAKQAADLRKKWSDRNFVLGFDLVGQEDSGHTSEYFLDDWVELKAYLDENDATLPLYFHDGESDWPSDLNLYDAYLLGTRRVGHGFNLFRFPQLERRLKASRVALEICPISNQVLRYVSDLRIHPANGYLNRGLPCVLSNDDPGILGNDGLSYDFWEAMVAWRLDLRGLKQLAQNSLVHSGMTESEKEAALANWQVAWNRWVASQ